MTIEFASFHDARRTAAAPSDHGMPGSQARDSPSRRSRPQRGGHGHRGGIIRCRAKRYAVIDRSPASTLACVSRVPRIGPSDGRRRRQGFFGAMHLGVGKPS
jgi:hypothetical protein